MPPERLPAVAARTRLGTMTDGAVPKEIVMDWRRSSGRQCRRPGRRTDGLRSHRGLLAVAPARESRPDDTRPLVAAALACLNAAVDTWTASNGSSTYRPSSTRL
jgi:hypothetical protein